MKNHLPVFSKLQFAIKIWSTIINTVGKSQTAMVLQFTPFRAYSLQTFKNSLHSLKLTITVYLIMMMIPNLKAQSFTGENTYGGMGDDRGNKMCKTTDGYFVVGSTTSAGAGAKDIYLMKLDNNEVIVWDQTYGGTDNEEALCVNALADGSCIVAGYTRSFGQGGQDFIFIKYDASGVFQWVRTSGGTLNEVYYDAIVTPDGGFAFCGFTGSPDIDYDALNQNVSASSGARDAILVKFNASGEYQWSKTYGGTGNETAYSLCLTPDSGFCISATTTSWSAQYNDIYMIRTNANGDTIWTTQTRKTGNDVPTSIAAVAGNYFVIAGRTNSQGIGMYDAFLYKLNRLGGHIFFKTYGDTEADAFNCISETEDHHYIAGGY